MPQGSRAKSKGTPKKPKISKVSKKGSKVTKRTPKKSPAQKKKLQKALENTIKQKVEMEVRTKAGGSSTLDKKPAAASKAKAKGGKKGKKK